MRSGSYSSSWCFHRAASMCQHSLRPATIPFTWRESRSTEVKLLVQRPTVNERARMSTPVTWVCIQIISPRWLCCSTPLSLPFSHSSISQIHVLTWTVWRSSWLLNCSPINSHAFPLQFFSPCTYFQSNTLNLQTFKTVMPGKFHKQVGLDSTGPESPLVNDFLPFSSRQYSQGLFFPYLPCCSVPRSHLIQSI